MYTRPEHCVRVRERRMGGGCMDGGGQLVGGGGERINKRLNEGSESYITTLGIAAEDKGEGAPWPPSALPKELAGD